MEGSSGRRHRVDVLTTLSVMSDLSSLAASLNALAGETEDPPRLLAVGWATVDWERAAAELGQAALEPADPEPALGARAWRARTGSIDLVLLEPSTEGRLAAFLARHGEGLAVLYLSVRTSAPGRPTALGRNGRLIEPRNPWGPFLIAVDKP
jgi:hypothetical protein